MANTTSVIDNLKDKNENLVYPRTLVKAVFDDDGTRLDSLLNQKDTNLTYISNKISGLSSICWETTVSVTPKTSTAPFSWTVTVPSGSVSDGTISHSISLSSSDSVIADLYIPSNATAETVKVLKSCWNSVDRIDVNNGSITIVGFGSVPSSQFSIRLQIHKHDFRSFIVNPT